MFKKPRLIWVTLAELFVIFVLVYILLMRSGSAGNIRPAFIDNGLPLGEDIVNCEFKVTSTFAFKNKKEITDLKNRTIDYETTKDNPPIMITFAGLSTDRPIVKSNNGDTPVQIVKKDTNTIVLIERNVTNDIFTYTIFKGEKVAVWQKTYSIFYTPFSLLSMGYCN